MGASQSYWSQLDKSNSAESYWKRRAGWHKLYILPLTFRFRVVQRKQDVLAVLHLCHQIPAIFSLISILGNKHSKVMHHYCDITEQNRNDMPKHSLFFLLPSPSRVWIMNTFAFHMPGAKRFQYSLWLTPQESERSILFSANAIFAIYGTTPL